MADEIANGTAETVGPAAVALALAGASREEADCFLREQRTLIADQRQHLHEQLKQIHLDVWEKRLGVWLRAATFCVGIAVAAGLGLMVWNASRSNGLLIEPFSVPGDLAGRGLTGQVISAKLLDRLVDMQAKTSSQRAPQSYANSWDEKGIKLDVPESGVSLTELDQFLREKLGRDTHVTGELVRTPSGLTLTARAGLNGADSVAGPDTDLDGLVQRLAESVYKMTQPYRYVIFLITHDRSAEAMPVLKNLAKTGSTQDRAWSYSVLGVVARDSEGIDAALPLLNRSLNIDPNLAVSLNNLARYETEKGDPEQALREDRLIVTLSTEREQVLPVFIPALRHSSQAQVDLLSGAFRDAAREQSAVIQSGLPGRWDLSADLAAAQAGEHELSAARATMADPVPDSGLAPGASAYSKIYAAMLIDSAAEDWAGVLSLADTTEFRLAKYPGVRADQRSLLYPLSAYAQARLGRFAAANARIAVTPDDCYGCLIARARIAELQGQRVGADAWFAKAVERAPSIPFAYADWGQALLGRRQPDAAIEKFKLSIEKGPHFADPLEGWGEALMAKNQSHLALTKFAEADKYAPDWGRLHLKWGEALIYVGRRDDAKAQFSRAAVLDLTPSEKSELVRMHHV
jgi:tetratricopeptide (TPR) repeat protein